MLHPILSIIGYCVLALPESESVHFVNLCAEAGITYKDVSPCAEGGTRRVIMTELASRRALRLCAAVGIPLSRESRHGLPELARSLMRRPGLVLGALASALLIWSSGRVLWDINVVGAVHVSEEHVISVLRECGLHVGSRLDSLDVDNIQTRALILSDEISYLSVNVRGTVAEVEIRELVEPPEDDDIVCSNLVAAHGGTIAYFDKVRGSLCVELGEAVSEGQLLVSGVWGSESEAMRFTRARGSVFALCEREYDVSVPLEYVKKVYTGEQKVDFSIIFFEKEVKFFGKCRNSYASCDTIDKVEYIDLFGLGALPVGIRTVRYVEYEEQVATLDERTAAAQAEHLLWESFFADSPESQLVSKHVEGTLTDTSYELYARIEGIEDIAVEKKVELDIIN